MSGEYRNLDVYEKKKKPWLIPVIVGGCLTLFFILIIVGIVAFCVITYNSPNQRFDRKMSEAKKYYYKEDYDNAIRAYEEALVIYSESEEAYLQIGRSYDALADENIKKGDTNGAVSCLIAGMDRLDEGYMITGSEVIKEKIDEMADKKNAILGLPQQQGSSQGPDAGSNPAPDPKLEEACGMFIQALETNDALTFMCTEKFDNGGVSFKLAYMDDDDIPELIVDEQGTDGTSMCVYGMKNGLIQMLGRYQKNKLEEYYYLERTGYVLIYGHSGLEEQPNRFEETFYFSSRPVGARYPEFFEYWTEQYDRDGNLIGGTMDNHTYMVYISEERIENVKKDDYDKRLEEFGLYDAPEYSMEGELTKQEAIEKFLELIP